MKFKLISILFLSGSLIGMSSCRKTVKSNYCRIQIIIDGKDSEWDASIDQSEKRLEGVYTVCNNDSFLYILVKGNNRRWLRQINRRGFTLWLDNEGQNGWCRREAHAGTKISDGL